MTNVIVFDTETANSLDDPIMYDIGWAVVCLETGKVIKTESFAIKEVFFDKELMETAYYKEKIPQYWKEIWAKERKIATLAEIRKNLCLDCKKFEVSEMWAHNARFDYRSTATTQRYFTNSTYRYFLPYGVTVKDTLKYSRHVLKNCEEYDNFCYNNNYLTERGCKRYTAEILYRFIKGVNDFEEAHRGLDDVLIEKEILLYCYNKDKEFDARLW